MSDLAPGGDPRSIPIRQSHLKQMRRSPAHYYASLITERADSKAMRLGRFVHAALLGGPTFHVYDGERRGNRWKEFQAEHAGEEIVTGDEEMLGLAIASAVRANRYAMRLLEGTREQEIDWTVAGRRCHGRPDVVGTDGVDGFVTELKTTFDAQPEHFVRHCERMGYLAQLAWYLDGLNAPDCTRDISLPPIARAYVVAVETTFPFVVTPCELTPNLIDIGRRSWRLWFEQVRMHEESGVWPGYVDSIAALDLPDESGLTLVMGDDTEEVAA